MSGGAGGRQGRTEPLALLFLAALLGAAALWSANPGWGELPLPGLRGLVKQPFVAWLTFALVLVMTGLLLCRRCRDREYFADMAGFFACLGVGLCLFASLGAGLAVLVISGAASRKADALAQDAAAHGP